MQGVVAVHLLRSGDLGPDFTQKAQFAVGLSIFSLGFLLAHLPTARTRPNYEARKRA